MDRDLHRVHGEMDTSHWWFLGRRRIIEQTIRHFVPSGRGTVVDLGSGGGGLLPMLAMFGSVVAVEGDAENAAIARHRNPEADVRVGTLPASLDGLPRARLVTAFDVIEHIDDDIGVLRGMASLLEPDGRLCVTVPALPWLWSAHDEANGHRRRYTARSLRAALDRAGLQVEHVSYFNTLLLPMVALARLAQRVRGGGSAGGDFDRSLGPLDAALRWVFGLERFLVPRFELPLGVSLIAVARR